MRFKFVLILHKARNYFTMVSHRCKELPERILTEWILTGNFMVEEKMNGFLQKKLEPVVIFKGFCYNDFH